MDTAITIQHSVTMKSLHVRMVVACRVSPLTLILKHQHASTSLNLQSQLQQNVFVQTGSPETFLTQLQPNEEQATSSTPPALQKVISFFSQLVHSISPTLTRFPAAGRQRLQEEPRRGERAFTLSQHGCLTSYITRNRYISLWICVHCSSQD